MIARLCILGLGAATFLVAAKVHGRQIRLERELAGYWEVTFGGQNPEFVDALWRRERWLYWGLVASLALFTIGFRVLAPRFGWSLPLSSPDGQRSLLGAGILHVIFPLTGAFLVTGLLSVGRFVSGVWAGVPPSEGRPVAWLSTAAWGTAGWWTLVLGMGIALVFLAWRRWA